MPNYTKLFNSIVTSTIWTEDDKTRILWITMLALADQNGEVHASIPGLARLAGIDMESTEKAIECFLSPDPYSRTPDNEGRRIAKIDGGWELLNHAKYRKMASKEDSKAATAERVRRHRHRNAPVTACNAPVTEKRDIAEAEAEADKKKDAGAPFSIPFDEMGASEPASIPITKTSHIALDEISAKIRKIKPGWNLPMTYAENRAILEAQSLLESLTDDQWGVLIRYMSAKLPQGDPGWQPRTRSKFIETVADVWSYADQWDRKNAPKPTIAKPKQAKTSNDPPMTADEINEILGLKKKP
jgi:hypothetical protein